MMKGGWAVIIQEMKNQAFYVSVLGKDHKLQFCRSGPLSPRVTVRRTLMKAHLTFCVKDALYLLYECVVSIGI